MKIFTLIVLKKASFFTPYDHTPLLLKDFKISITLLPKYPNDSLSFREFKIAIILTLDPEIVFL